MHQMGVGTTCDNAPVATGGSKTNQVHVNANPLCSWNQPVAGQFSDTFVSRDQRDQGLCNYRLFKSGGAGGRTSLAVFASAILKGEVKE
jgi:hypothetical protein